MMGTRTKLFPSVVVFLLLCTLQFAAVADTDAEDPAVLYSKWIASYTDVWAPREKDPLFLRLLKTPGADLWFLKGLHHASDPVRRLSQRGLAELKTDRSFEALVAAMGDPDMFVRERSLRALSDYQ